MLRSVSNDDLAPPPSEEDIFGQIEMVKKQFEEENNQLNRQLEENKVSNANKVFKSFTKITLHFVDENESEFPRKVGCQKTKKS